MNTSSTEFIQQKTMTLYKINQLITEALVEYGLRNINGGMVGQFTKIMYDNMEQGDPELIKQKTIELYEVNQTILKELEKSGLNNVNLAMVGQFTKIIYGEIKEELE